jgi:hypothetical protein
VRISKVGPTRPEISVAGPGSVSARSTALHSPALLGAKRNDDSVVGVGSRFFSGEDLHF